MQKFSFLVILQLFSLQLVAQDSTAIKQEVWPEVNLFYRINERFRLYAKYSATKLRNSAYTDGGWGAYLDYFAFSSVRKMMDPNIRDSTSGYYLWLRAGYMYSTTPPESEDPFKLHTIVTEANIRFHLPYHILLTNKNRFDWRIIKGNFEPRYRPRLTLEKEMHTKYLFFTPNIYCEYFVYFKAKGINRFRISAGIQTKVTAHLEFETYFVHQFDNGKKVNGLNAMGLVLKLYFRHNPNKIKHPKS